MATKLEGELAPTDLPKGVELVAPGVLKVVVDQVPWEIFPEPSGRIFPPNQLICGGALIPACWDSAPGIIGANQPPGFIAEMHSHGTDMVYYFLGGGMSMPGEGTYEPGHMRIVDADTVYGPEWTEDGGTHFLLFAIGNDFITDWVDDHTPGSSIKVEKDYTINPVAEIKPGVVEVIPGIRKIDLAAVPWEPRPDAPEGAPPVQVISENPGVVSYDMPAGYEIPEHSFPTEMVYIITDGEVSVAGETTYRAGDLRVAEADVEVGRTVAGPGGAKGIAITIGSLAG